MLSNIRFSIYVLITLILFGETCATNSTGFFGTVRDLKVHLYQDAKVEKSEVYKSLKLNVSWCQPEGSRVPSSYSVIVTSVLEENSTECSDGSIFYTSKDNKELSVLLPQTNGIIDMSEMHIFPGCSYKIQVHANPRLKPSIKTPEIIYKVPNCVSGKCNCLSAKSTLPIPKVNVLESDDDLIIEWNVNNDSNIYFYIINIGHPILTSRNGLAVYNMTKIGDVYAPKTVFQLNQWKNINIESGFKISVSPVDFQGCVGDEGIFIIPSSPLESSIEISWFILVGAIAICMTVSILLLFKTKHKYKLFWGSRSMPRIHALPKCKSQWAESMLNKQNILYVRYDPQAEYASESDQLEISYKNLNLVHELGRGQFGKVYLGRLDDGEETLVAVKTSQSFDEQDEIESRKQFMEEIDIMRQAGTHPNLVRLIGYCSQPDKPICIILEYMQGGDLLAYLHSRRKIKRSRSQNESQSTSGRSSRPSISETLYTTLSYVSETISQGNPTYSSIPQAKKYINISEVFTTNDQENTEEFEDGSIGRKQFVQFAMDIASGMKHLEAKGITHRDLAARNILVSSDFTLKISDFGLSRNGVYVIRTKGSKARHLPIRWMSPEAIRDRAFSTKSDVWSFAIVLWEIATLGSFPYPSIPDDRLLSYIVREGGRLERPETISADVYQLMEQCWATEPEDRPNFKQISLHLQAINVPTSSPTSADNPCYVLPVETLES